MNVDGAQSMSSGDLVELANLIATVRKRSPKTADEVRAAFQKAVEDMNAAIEQANRLGIHIGGTVNLTDIAAPVDNVQVNPAEPRTYTEEQAKEALRVAVRELNDAIGALAAFGIDTGFDVVDVSDPRHAAPQYSLTAVLRRRFEEGELERI
jgi:hypothetical protein